MQYIWAVIWSFLLGLMISYVIPSMTGGHFELELGLILGTVFSVFTILFTVLMPQGENQEDPTH
ncbi:hypothetical protein SAMN05877753_108227 [Bacillus oleivorans]|uniref:DUF2929 family protein n=1 Tax=Bacillus oleivorans TaxID=1448271 RepID=A0A285D3D8_9BACI|nr:YjzD family protein [Bacillus oleivorans]SNX74205.1 hypothetical protein SAMN05877753_108227 [Bacillus oleivorans]